MIKKNGIEAFSRILTASFVSFGLAASVRPGNSCEFIMTDTFPTCVRSYDGVVDRNYGLTWVYHCAVDGTPGTSDVYRGGATCDIPLAAGRR